MPAGGAPTPAGGRRRPRVILLDLRPYRALLVWLAAAGLTWAAVAGAPAWLGVWEEEILAVLSAALDAGHGGPDPGAVSPLGFSEKTVTLDIARRLARHLRAAGIEVTMTRSGDRALHVYRRADLEARAARVNARQPDVLLSLHVDSYPADPGVAGPRTYYQQGSLRGQRLALMVQRELARATGTGDYGARPADYFITRSTRAPAALVEVGFLTNPAEAARLADPAYRERLAAAIARGVMAYFRSP